MGLPDKPELIRVQQLMRKVVEALEGADLFDAGRIIGNGEIVQAFRASRPAPGEVTNSLGFLKKTSFVLESFEDSDWTWFRENLEPDAL